MGLDSAIQAVRDGEFLVVTDDRSGISELVIPARAVTPARVNFMASMGGIVGIATTRERCDELGLPPMPQRGRDGEVLGHHFTFESRFGVSTGISSFDRAATILTAGDPEAGADDVVRPGHVLPTAANPVAALARCGVTEAAVFLAERVGLFPVMARCALLDEHGELLAGAKLDQFCERESLGHACVEEILDRRDLDLADPIGAIEGTSGVR